MYLFLLYSDSVILATMQRVLELAFEDYNDDENIIVHRQRPRRALELAFENYESNVRRPR